MNRETAMTMTEDRADATTEIEVLKATLARQVRVQTDALAYLVYSETSGDSAEQRLRAAMDCLEASEEEAENVELLVTVDALRELLEGATQTFAEQFTELYAMGEAINDMVLEDRPRAIVDALTKAVASASEVMRHVENVRNELGAALDGSPTSHR